MKVPNTMLDLAMSAAAGYVGTKAMEPVSMKLYELEPKAARTGRTPCDLVRRTGSLRRS